MPPDQYQALIDSIGEIGVQNPITLLEGMVLDGWHRYRAAIDAEMDCPSVELGEVDPKDFVMAQNKARRHITAAQLAMATTAVYAWAPAGKPKLHTECAVKTAVEMAEMIGVHRNTIVQAQAVHNKAAPEVQAAVRRGEVGLPKAAAIAKLPLDAQAAALRKPVPKPVKASAPVAAPVGEPAPQEEGPSAEELAAHAAAQAADAAMVQQLLESDAPLAAAMQENQRLNAEVAQLKQRIHGLMNEKNEAIALVKSRDRQIAQLQKRLQVPA